MQPGMTLGLPWPFISPLFITQISIYRWERSVKPLTHRGHLWWSVLLAGGMNGCLWNKEGLCTISLHLCGVAIILYHFMKETEDAALIIPHLACFVMYLAVMTSWWINVVMSASTELRECLHYELWRSVFHFAKCVLRYRHRWCRGVIAGFVWIFLLK